MVIDSLGNHHAGDGRFTTKPVNQQSPVDLLSLLDEVDASRQEILADARFHADWSRGLETLRSIPNSGCGLELYVEDGEWVVDSYINIADHCAVCFYPLDTSEPASVFCPQCKSKTDASVFGARRGFSEIGNQSRRAIKETIDEAAYWMRSRRDSRCKSREEMIADESPRIEKILKDKMEAFQQADPKEITYLQSQQTWFYDGEEIHLDSTTGCLTIHRPLTRFGYTDVFNVDLLLSTPWQAAVEERKTNGN
jgi:uncharacterized Zn finger protein (UPF0148 family)